MIHDPSSSSWFTALKNGGQKGRPTSRRRKKDENHIGLLPTEGWRKRNLQFIGEVLIPSLLSPRRPGEDFGALPEVDEKGIGVTWLGHAGFLVRAGGLNIAIDPNWALWHGPVKRVRHPSLRAADMPPIDLVLVTHAHFDHLHLPSLRKIAAEQPIIVPHGVGSLVKRCGFGRVVELEMWQRAIFRDVQITLTPARHWGARMIHDTHRMFGGYLIQSKERTVFHCGDSAIFDGFVEIGKRADIVFVGFDDLNPLRLVDDEMFATLPAERAPGRGILHLFKAAVWTFHTNFGRRLGHRGAGGAIA